jgi:C-terminal processing protease CtpA/Prc
MPAEVIERVHSLATHSPQGLNYRNKNEDSDIDLSSQDENSYHDNDEEGMYYHPITTNRNQSDDTQDDDDDSNPSLDPAISDIIPDSNDNHSSQSGHSEIEELSEGMDNQIAGVDPNTIEDTFEGADVNPTLRRSTRMI